MKADNDLTILVNTSDGFDDCWRPFFTLLSRFWPGCPHPIVLNTETLDFTYDGLDLRAARVAVGEPQPLTWSRCLARCLDSIETPFVLYLQEDFFLEAPVRTEALQAMLGALREGRADVVRLMECGGSGPWHTTTDPLLWEVDRRADYRIALQAGLWRKATLRRHLRMHEGPWQFEVLGSARARRARGETVMCAARDRYHGPGNEIFPYEPTGIVKGRWERHIVVPLFAAHGIEVDFARRGFADEPRRAPPRPALLRRVADRARSIF